MFTGILNGYKIEKKCFDPPKERIDFTTSKKSLKEYLGY